MCGIAGIVNRDGGPVDVNLIRDMTDRVTHRGPDGSGYEVAGSVALGHRRLSILDLSESGRQPMTFGNSGLTITYNGEIYNYIELRAELETKGYRFATGTDTEVILAAYDAWGETSVTRFNGMWAFAIHDQRRNLLFCSRDRFGVKPFYYIDTPRMLAFGSEIRQLLPLLEQTKANQATLQSFLVTDAAELDDSTFFQGIHKLPGGHSAIYNLETHKFTIKEYYTISFNKEVYRLNTDEAVEYFLNLFQSSIRLRLRSDVKVGTCLSGGLDSSSVATLAALYYAEAGGGNFSAITAVSEQESNSEAHFAKMVANASSLDWHTVKPTYNDFIDTLPAVVRTQEEPYGSPSITMQYFVMQTARRNGITVLLDGQGGDETLLGYEKYYAAYIAEQFKTSGLNAAINAIRSSGLNNAKMGPVNVVKYLLGGMIAPLRYAFYKRRHHYMKRHKPLPQHLTAFAKNCTNPFRLQELEIRSTNLPILLRYEDKNSMAHAIETRLPFLDYRLLETSLSLAGKMKIRDGWSKWILRQAMDNRMPKDVVWRKNKFGFEAPEDAWLTQHASIMKQTVLNSPLLGEMVNKEALTRTYQRLDKRSRWRLYSTALWEKSFGVSA